jgi:hypothetical protein
MASTLAAMITPDTVVSFEIDRATLLQFLVPRRRAEKGGV